MSMFSSSSTSNPSISKDRMIILVEGSGLLVEMFLRDNEIGNCVSPLSSYLYVDTRYNQNYFAFVNDIPHCCSHAPRSQDVHVHSNIHEAVENDSVQRNRILVVLSVHIIIIILTIRR